MSLARFIWCKRSDTADMLDTKIGRKERSDPADVAKQGFDAMVRGDGQVITGWQN
jgi:uncharacterized protein